MLFIDSLRAFHYDCRRDANKYNSSIHDGISETNHSKIKCDGNQYLKTNENI